MNFPLSGPPGTQRRPLTPAEAGGRQGLRRGRVEVFPLLSRSNNIGFEGGIHAHVYSGEQMKAMQYIHHWAGSDGVRHAVAPSEFRGLPPDMTAVFEAFGCGSCGAGESQHAAAFVG